MRSKYGWNNNYNGSDSVGFTVLPAGYYSSVGVYGFFGVGDRACFWTGGGSDWIASTRVADFIAYNSYLEFNASQGYWCSIRCVKD